MQNASHDLPKAIHTAIPTVICCFILTNLSYYLILPWDALGSSNAVAVVRHITLFIPLSFPKVASELCSMYDTVSVLTPLMFSKLRQQE